MKADSIQGELFHVSEITTSWDWIHEKLESIAKLSIVCCVEWRGSSSELGPEGSITIQYHDARNQVQRWQYLCDRYGHDVPLKMPKDAAIAIISRFEAIYPSLPKAEKVLMVG